MIIGIESAGFAGFEGDVYSYVRCFAVYAKNPIGVRDTPAKPRKPRTLAASASVRRGKAA